MIDAKRVAGLVTLLAVATAIPAERSEAEVVFAVSVAVSVGGGHFVPTKTSEVDVAGLEGLSAYLTQEVLRMVDDFGMDLGAKERLFDALRIRIECKTEHEDGTVVAFTNERGFNATDGSATVESWLWRVGQETAEVFKARSRMSTPTAELDGRR